MKILFLDKKAATSIGYEKTLARPKISCKD